MYCPSSSRKRKSFFFFLLFLSAVTVQQSGQRPPFTKIKIHCKYLLLYSSSPSWITSRESCFLFLGWRTDCCELSPFSDRSEIAGSIATIRPCAMPKHGTNKYNNLYRACRSDDRLNKEHALFNRLAAR